jgi:hypothetical protein
MMIKADQQAKNAKALLGMMKRKKSPSSSGGQSGSRKTMNTAKRVVAQNLKTEGDEEDRLT